jgi:hypothetical protein
MAASQNAAALQRVRFFPNFFRVQTIGARFACAFFVAAQGLPPPCLRQAPSSE